MTVEAPERPIPTGSCEMWSCGPANQVGDGVLALWLWGQSDKW
jgi:hypothetical protein